MFRLAATENTLLFILIPLAIFLFILAFYGKKKALLQFADIKLLSVISGQFSPIKNRFKVFLILISLFFIIFSLLRPQGNPISKEVKKRGRDIVFIIDVSRSMLAEDIYPNRLGKAKQLVADVVDSLIGDRVGLLVFAGATAVKCPLTLDYSYFKNILERISPQDINKGGSLIGDSIRTVSEKLFYDNDNKFRDIILITDGEDQESFPVEAAEEASKKGIKIHTVGLGDPSGSNIPLREAGSYTLLKHKDETVKTRLDEGTLIKIAQVTNAVYVPVRTDQVDLADLYKKHISPADKKETTSQKSLLWSELFQFFLVIAIISLMLEPLINDRKSS